LREHGRRRKVPCESDRGIGFGVAAVNFVTVDFDNDLVVAVKAFLQVNAEVVVGAWGWWSDRARLLRLSASGEQGQCAKHGGGKTWSVHRSLSGDRLLVDNGAAPLRQSI